MKAIVTLIAAGIALAALGGCQEGGDEEREGTEQRDGEQDGDDD